MAEDVFLTGSGPNGSGPRATLRITRPRHLPAMDYVPDDAAAARPPVLRTGEYTSNDAYNACL